jgi:hypothetical protein
MVVTVVTAVTKNESQNFALTVIGLSELVVARDILVT